ncbi:MAG: leucine-rich repeat domain-containing protein [Bacteroidaceae bacterium]|nr:leucine-rich repeat domain-containing protein [Bacteroidaceae bacterium]
MGGIIGYAKFINLFNNAVVSCIIETNDNIAGGVAGCIEGNKEKCDPFKIRYNRVINSTIHASDDYCGGLIGEIANTAPGDILTNYVQDCTVTCGDDSGGDYLGGLVGYCELAISHVDDNYVHAKLEAKRDACIAGLFMGYFYQYRSLNSTFNYTDNEYCDKYRYWIGKVDGFGHPVVYAKTTAQMTTVNIDGYFYKRGAMPQLRDGSVYDITVTTAAQLQQIAADVNSGARTYEGCIVKLEADIDLSSIDSFTPIGTSTYPFMGEFDGCGFTISGLTINRPNDNDTGLFGYVHNAYIHDVIMEAPNVTGGPYYTGALVGMAQSTCGVTDVWVRPSATATPYVKGYASTGGIMGRSDKRLLMENCYFEGTVVTRYDQQGDAWAGALAANIKSGNVSDCGTKATITRQDNGSLIKGLIGGMSTLTEGNRTVELTRCYAANSDASALPLVGSATEQLTLTSCHNGPPVGGNGMASVLGTANWYYYQEKDKLPLPITLSKDLPGSDLAYYNDFYFLPNEDNRETYHVIDYKGNGGSITIPSTVNNKPVTRIDSDVLQGNRTITSVTISENITGIGHRAFEGCTALKTLTINSSSPLHIGSMAFAGCTALTTINFYCGNFDYTYTDNEGVTDGGYAFSNCTNLTKLDFLGKANPLDGLKSKGAFSGCTNITDISASANYLSVLTAGNTTRKAGIVSKNGSTLHMVIPAASTFYGDEEGQFEIPPAFPH